MSITRYFGEPRNIVITFNENPLSLYGKTYDDIENIKFSLKNLTARDDDDAYLQKYYKDSNAETETGNVLFDASKNSFVLVLEPSDYQNLIVGENYEVVLGVKVPQYDEYIELSLIDPTLTIINDKLRE